MIIKNAQYEISNAKASQCPDITVPEYAFIGRSNVGKSSLINMLTRRSSLAKTSQKPGKTLLINHFSINNGEWYIVDLPGYGYAARSKDARDKIGQIIKDYVLNRHQMTCLFVLLDVRHDPQKIDLEFLNFLGENGVPFALIFTKTDKIGPVVAERNVAAYKKVLMKSWEELPPIFLTSSEKGTGRDEVLDFIEKINKDVKVLEKEEQSPVVAIGEVKTEITEEEILDGPDAE